MNLYVYWFLSFFLRFSIWKVARTSDVLISVKSLVSLPNKNLYKCHRTCNIANWTYTGHQIIKTVDGVETLWIGRSAKSHKKPYCDGCLFWGTCWSGHKIQGILPCKNLIHYSQINCIIHRMDNSILVLEFCCKIMVLKSKMPNMNVLSLYLSICIISRKNLQ